jgi:hypothetical protein
MSGFRGRGTYQRVWGSTDQTDRIISSDFSMTADIFCRNLFVINYTLTTNGYRIFASDGVYVEGTIVAPGAIDNSGNNGDGGGAGGTGGTGGPAATLGGGFSGGNGGVTTFGANGQGTSLFSLAGSTGGNGGTSSPPNTPGLGAAATFDQSTYGYALQPSVADMGILFGLTSGFNRIAGGGGGGGGPGDNVKIGGGGGGGGGVIGIWTGGVISLKGHASIQVFGGDGGGAEGGGGAGGGGAGGGGTILLNAERILFPDASNAAKLIVDGGSGGSRTGGTGGNGNNGTSGSIWIVAARGHQHFGSTVHGDSFPNGLPVID